ncbi:MAG: diguanylate cyclase [Dechloromonas sp.]|nr:MAG: diguanylate cyclase [Dechloromonas sp.]
MLLRPTISARPAADPALDQRQLFDIGLAAARRLSGRTWTDHNTHDPGITQLELLAYALTDLAYRARLPIEDILAVPDDNAAAMDKLFDRASRILPNAPVTLADYRKLLIDRPGIKNAWLHQVPVTLHADPAKGKLSVQPSGSQTERPIAVRGRYRVTLEYMDDVRTAERRAEIDCDALATLHAHRGLGMDFVAPIQHVQPHWFSLCAEIDLTPEADANRVAADIRFAVDRWLAPPVHNFTLGEMLARTHDDGSTWTVPEIFDGPRLANGFIADADLADADLRREVRLSDVISVIMDIPGVVAIRDIVMNPLSSSGKAQEPGDKWRMPVDEGCQPRLAELPGRLVFYKKNLPIPPDPARVDTHFNALRRAERVKLEAAVAEEWPIPLGRYRNPARYRSVQAHFPTIYGLSEAGLPPGATPQRQAQALQLKAWLTLFDHVMAGYAAQLAHVRDLFSSDPAVAGSYYGQLVTDFPDWPKIYAEGFDAVRLDADVVEPGDTGLVRRNRFLDHLLARYAEDFSDYVAVMQARFGLAAAQAAAAKCGFLDASAETGARRGQGYNARLTAPGELWNTQTNLSGYERRIARLLDIVNPGRRNLSDVAYDMYAEVDAVPDSRDEFRFRIRHPVSGKILLSSSTHYAMQAAARTEMEAAIARAQRPEGYARKRTGTDETPEAERRHYFNIVAESGEVIARRIEYFADAAAMEAAIAELIAHLRERYSGEGLYVIEHILLLPEEAGDPLMDICTDAGCVDCADLDPYSDRITIVLPAYTGRFRDMDFRRFVEATLRREAPAHILPRICWVNTDDMAAIEGAYRDWLAIRSGATTAERAARIAALVNALTRAKNVYPASGLHPCGQLEPPPFVLGRNALGSATDLADS